MIQRMASATDEAAFDALAEDKPFVLEVLTALARELQLGDVDLPQRGSAFVGLTEHAVIKVMAPHDASFMATERACLRALDLPIETPRVLHEGSFHGWPYVVMTRLPGRELRDVWPTLQESAQLRLATELGESLRALHSSAPPAAIPRVSWADYVASQCQTMVEVQRRRGCPEPLLEGLPELAERFGSPDNSPAWLHTEVMLDHLLVTGEGSQAHLSGLFDFEPSWVAPVDYEFASVGVFFAGGNPRLLRAVLDAAGQSPSPQRLLAMSALHRYSNLGWYHRTLGGELTLEGVAQAWFAS